MNKFNYIVQIKAIKDMKTQKAREATMRTIYSSPDNILIQQYAWNRALKDVLEAKYEFKCFSKAYQDFTGKNLPLFLSEGIQSATTYAFTELVKSGVSYDELCDYFEFTTNIHMSGQQYSSFLLAYSEIIKNNVTPFTVTTSYYTTFPFRYIAEGLFDTKKYALTTLNNLMEVEDVKRRLPSNILYTPIEDILTSLYSKISTIDNTDLVEAAALLTQRVEHWVTDSQVIRNTIDVKKLGI